MKLSSRLLSIAVLLAGCAGGAATQLTPARPRAPCERGTIWDGTACRAHPGAGPVLEAAIQARKELRIEDSIAMLEQAIAAGPHHHDELAELYAALGIAHTFVEHRPEALRIFEMLLTIDPSYVIGYKLSEKTGPVFEEARFAARERPRPTLDVSWPRDLEVSRPVPVDIAVFADADQLLHAATLHMRRKGEEQHVSFDVALEPAGTFSRIVLPAPRTEAPEVLQLWATGLDAKGNEVVLWGDPTQPRELPLRYDAPTPWHRKWWVWAIAGGTVAAAAATTVYVLRIEAPDFVGGVVQAP